MKSATAFALVSLLASTAVAQPHRHQHQHQHLAKQEKRDNTVVWVTDYDYVTETIGVTTTIWVTEGFVEPTASSDPAPAVATTKPSTTLATSTSAEAAQFFEPETLPATSSSTSVYVAPPAPTPVYVAPTTSAAPVPTTSTTPVYVAPVVEVSSSPAAQVYTQAAAAPVAQPTTTAAAAAAVETQASSASSASSSQTYTGDITYYEAGLGACGWTNDGSTEKVIALPHELMGTQSNGNPFCGKMVTIKCTATGKTTTAKVVDKCMGCVGYAIDLSNAAFLDLDSLDVGRTTATWWFN